MNLKAAWTFYGETKRNEPKQVDLRFIKGDMRGRERTVASSGI